MQRTVQLADASIHVKDIGSGPVILLVHGFPLDHSMWSWQWDELARDHRVLAVDLRGFGASSPVPDTPLTMQQHADDLAALLDQLEIDAPVTLGGLSMGGYVAWQFWQRYGSKLAALILCDTRAAADSEEVARGRRYLAERVLREGNEQAGEDLLQKLFSDRTRSAHPDRIQATRDVIRRTPSASIAAAQRGMADRPDMTARLGEITCPALLVCGAMDVITPPDEMQSMAAQMPAAEFVRIADAGHMAPLENPSDTNAAVRSFLERHRI
jgi:3-oxoadipate enol-lactonase